MKTVTIPQAGKIAKVETEGDFRKGDCYVLESHGRSIEWTQHPRDSGNRWSHRKDLCPTVEPRGHQSEGPKRNRDWHSGALVSCQYT